MWDGLPRKSSDGCERWEARPTLFLPFALTALYAVGDVQPNDRDKLLAATSAWVKSLRNPVFQATTRKARASLSVNFPMLPGSPSVHFPWDGFRCNNVNHLVRTRHNQTEIGIRKSQPSIRLSKAHWKPQHTALNIAAAVESLANRFCRMPIHG